jgi:hypothetical protein
VELSEYLLETLREDDEFVLYRGGHSNQSGSSSVLLLAPASMQPPLATRKKIEHEYSLRDELDSAWALRPCPGNVGGRRSCSKTLDAKLSIDSFQGQWRSRSSCASPSVSQRHWAGCTKRELIYKDVKPANVLVNPATCCYRTALGRKVSPCRSESPIVRAHDHWKQLWDEARSGAHLWIECD